MIQDRFFRQVSLLFMLGLAGVLTDVGAAIPDEAKVLIIRTGQLPDITDTKVELTMLRRDPFNWPPDETEPGQKPARDVEKIFVGMKLNAIIWQERLPLAIVNNKLLEVGDILKGATVLEIYKEGVVMEKEGLYHTLRLATLEIDLREKKKKEKFSPAPEKN